MKVVVSAAPETPSQEVRVEMLDPHLKAPSAPSFKEFSQHVEVGGTRNVVAKDEGRLRPQVRRSLREVPGEHKEGEVGPQKVLEKRDGFE